MSNRNTRFTNSFSEEVWASTYKYHTDGDVNDTHARVADNLASIEANPVFWSEKFKDVLADFRFVPGGRISSNAGTGLKNTTYINCFVSAPGGRDIDSMEGILRELRHNALILKSEGGYGFCADFMRPRGSFVEGIGVESPGAVQMLDMWDKQSEVITAGSGQKKRTAKGKNKIRKGAMMVTMSCWHPSIEEFITAKQTSGRLTKFNMSVLVTDDFMEACRHRDPWKLEFPETTHERYEDEWDGDLASWKFKGYPVRVWREYEDANDLWDLIMESTYGRNEPGVLFVDTINRMNNLWYCEHITATNPCGEQVLPPGGVCLLGSLNLTQYINADRTDWDFGKLREDIPVIVRMMDNVNDLTSVPLEEQRKNLKLKRRIGLGYLGWGSALMMMRVRYGSDKALELERRLGWFVSNMAYQASANLAEEKGSFPLFDADKYLFGEFVQTLEEETREMIRQKGMRNSHLLSIQPTGNSSVYANNVSGGLEPVFRPEYFRTMILSHAPEGLQVPASIDWSGKSYHFKGAAAPDWKWAKEGDEDILVTTFEGTVYKIDRSRGLLKETPVEDYAVTDLKARGEWDPKADWAAGASDLKIDEHLSTMKVFSQFIDSAMSKTVNLPNNYPYDDFQRLYMEAWATGTIKGCTTYREGTMAAVLAEKSTAEGEPRILKNKAPKRPKAVPVQIHQLTANGEKWVAIVGMLGEDPYEVFCLRAAKIGKIHGDGTGRLVRSKRGKYDLEVDGNGTFEDIRQYIDSDAEEALSRMISTALRHGADIEFVVTQLMKSEGSIVSFSKAMARTLKKYVKGGQTTMTCSDCGSKNVVMAEGCYRCSDCGGSKCG